MGPVLMPHAQQPDQRFHCAVEDARRSGWKRCKQQCASCLQWALQGSDGKLDTTCETATGLYFDFAGPRADQITLRDVASHLALTCRFGGATTDPADRDEPFFYSVAQHALFVRDTVGEWGHPELCLPALHHDDHEFMLGDWPTPLKRALRAAGVTVLDEMVRATNRAIGERFGVDPDLFDHPILKEADTLALYREAATFKQSQGVGPHWGREQPATPLTTWPLHPGDVMREFMKAHKRDGGLDA